MLDAISYRLLAYPRKFGPLIEGAVDLHFVLLPMRNAALVIQCG